MACEHEYLPKLSKNLQNFAALRAGLLSLHGNKMLANKDHFETKKLCFSVSTLKFSLWSFKYKTPS